MVLRDRLGDALQQHRLSCPRRCDDEAALPLADGRHQVEHASGQRLRRRFEDEALLRIERGQVFEEEFVAREVG